MAACKACGAEIFWMRTQRSRSIPLDHKPNVNGNVILIGDTAQVVSKKDLDEVRASGVTIYMPHHATCPKAEQFKGGE